ncbi:hypothetical protein [Alkalibacter saccharofermentans]|uniref:Uncharacterized protein n=1 Tax=Alkalibacter saccharofermentans DSM 14828 TaxID=1120975 RepID=A0A1M4YMT1_9FIRM|nr:hypothetical protein [Alkalibacter saccharofermentans]SHF06963.1 hypothetical protein SAMN02746064_01814 [Alkalibacter saccharofermentans DSM 14828]
MKSKSILVILIVLLMSYSFVNAKSIESRSVTYRSEKITDLELIQQRIDEGITDDDSFKAIASLSETEHVDENGEKFYLEVTSIGSTSQKLKRSNEFKW